MPGSAPDFRQTIFDRVRGHQFTILDVGAGEGTYADLLRDYEYIDAIEIYAPYIVQYQLQAKYRKVHEGDARELLDNPDFPAYDVIILGAILEHMKRSEAQRLLESCQQKARHEVIVTVPFRTPQGAVNGNQWETHVQDDLTALAMSTHFPALIPQIVNDKRGFYIARGQYAG